MNGYIEPRDTCAKGCGYDHFRTDIAAEGLSTAVDNMSMVTFKLSDNYFQYLE